MFKETENFFDNAVQSKSIIYCEYHYCFLPLYLATISDKSYRKISYFDNVAKKKTENWITIFDVTLTLHGEIKFS